jgi:hypothetical protein
MVEIELPRPRPEGITMEDRFFRIVAEIKKKIVLDVEQQKSEGKYTSQAYSTVT